MNDLVSVKIVADSIYNGIRLTTMELEYPRYIHSEVMTHRVFSRNAQSNRAIPTTKQIKAVQESTWYPIFMENKPGMEASTPVIDTKLMLAQHRWNRAKEKAVESAISLNNLNIHKQISSRVLEPFSKIKVIISSTEWSNFFNLRISPQAQQEICLLATEMKEAKRLSIPTKLDVCNWHLPYILVSEKYLDIELLKKLSVARCARISYLNHNRISDHTLDVDLHDNLLKNRHMSPFEHIATPSGDHLYYNNFRGWEQYRYDLGL